ncbi:hypothetical protein EJ05DRAFT_296675 [Pseudovirgaria hyperparasitica]|uniref:Transmembrane protein n=1 Tax=Pseudovirgaria hyperparasitica TaxID=470096 RepID=A0A6A6VPI5_9PEZI|nr:uncharacterized protein EJ05DRAFT_296675 [Pseudovirgaria hyperparasitica]KAF2752532.1 hypothetical protein EJ05DRAFT_296675 [Pseudovirgaria hyperparasitica]
MMPYLSWEYVTALCLPSSLGILSTIITFSFVFDDIAPAETMCIAQFFLLLGEITLMIFWYRARGQGQQSSREGLGERRPTRKESKGNDFISRSIIRHGILAVLIVAIIPASVCTNKGIPYSLSLTILLALYKTNTLFMTLPPAIRMIVALINATRNKTHGGREANQEHSNFGSEEKSLDSFDGINDRPMSGMSFMCRGTFLTSSIPPPTQFTSRV